MFQIFKAFAVLFLCGICSHLSAQTFTVETVPDPKQSPGSHYVSNPAGILSAAAVARLDSLLGRLEDSTTAQVAVVVLPSIGEAVPKDFANALFQKWGVGRAQNDNGLLILFVLDQRRVEMETGYGLEGVLPDITCARIQREKMVPAFQSGDYNAGLVAGVEAIYETLAQPEAAQEIDAEKMYGEEEKSYIAPMDQGDILFLPFIFFFVLIILRLFRWIVRSVNPVKTQIDEVIRKKSGHFWLGVVLYFGVPFLIALSIHEVATKMPVAWNWAFLFCYAYLAFLIWDSRMRRMKVFLQLFGNMSEPEQYMRLRTATRFYWFDALLFPIPFVWLWSVKNGKLNRLRNHPRTSPDGHTLFKVADEQKVHFLTAYQKVEEELKTVEYDIWHNAQHNFTEAVGYESLGKSKYTRCGDCHSKALKFEQEEVLKAATTEAEGRSKRHYQCKACGVTSSQEIVLPILQPVGTSSSNGTWSSASSSGWSSGSSYSGGSSSWGGGRSGGGGAGSSW